MAYTTIDDPALYFNTIIYTGDGSGATVSGVGFQPDLNWTKQRSGTESHYLVDAVRGVTKTLYTVDTSVPDTIVNSLTAFNSDGYVHGDLNAYAQSSITFVSWNWKANGAGSANTDGSINTTKTSANTTSGFSIITYTGDGNASATIGHGLGAKPSLIINKNLTDNGYDWNVQHGSLGATKYLYLSTTAAVATNAGMWNDTEPTSSLFTIGTWDNVNKSSSTYLAYVFAPIQGFSKFGSFEGVTSTDGPFIYTGFTPSMILYKNADYAENWHIQSLAQESINPNNNQITPNMNYAESSDANTNIDFLAQGFKMRSSHRTSNYGGDTIIYAAFAAAPFVNSNGVPCNAR